MEDIQSGSADSSDIRYTLPASLLVDTLLSDILSDMLSEMLPDIVEWHDRGP